MPKGTKSTRKYKKYKNPTVLCIARLVKYKRIQDLILAVYLLRDRFPDIKLIIVGKDRNEIISNFKFQIANCRIMLS